MKFCEKCGQMLVDDAEFCTSCGTKCKNEAQTTSQNFSQNNYNSNYNQNFNNGVSANIAYNTYTPSTPGKPRLGHNTLTRVSFAFIVVALVFQALAIIESFILLIAAPAFGIIFFIAEVIAVCVSSYFIRKINQAVNSGYRLSTGFKVCVLLFNNIVSGICLLCDKEH